jgi:hypothetical protein
VLANALRGQAPELLKERGGGCLKAQRGPTKLSVDLFGLFMEIPALSESVTMSIVKYSKHAWNVS